VIFGEPIVEFDGAELQVGTGGQASLTVSAIADPGVLIAIQSEWIGRTDATEQSTFHWPAVFNRNPAANTFVVHSGPEISTAQGLVQTYSTWSVPCDRATRGPLTYVSFVETAPWNRPASGTRKFKRIGSLLLAVASSMSIVDGTDGLLGLHAMDSVADYYRNLGFRRIDCLNEYRELYFELPREHARTLRQRLGVER
jgi:hypothetical protein